MTYIDSTPTPAPYIGGHVLEDGHSWAAFTNARLAWLYGEDHATTRAAATAADLAAWDRVGAGRVAA